MAGRACIQRTDALLDAAVRMRDAMCERDDAKEVLPMNWEPFEQVVKDWL